MQILKAIVASLVLMSAATGSAWAQHGYYGRDHFHSNVYLGFGVGPYWGPGWYGPPPAYYYPPTVVVQQPPVYVEQVQAAPAAPAAEASNYWYYCPPAKRYYPYVTQCPSGWQQVSPTPPGP